MFLKIFHFKNIKGPAFFSVGTFGKSRLAPLVKMILKDINWWKIANIGNENTEKIL